MYTVEYTKEEDIAHRQRMHALAMAFPLQNQPDNVDEKVGEYEENGHVTVYKMLHAADLVVADRKGCMMLIHRNFPPLGLAPAGGMMDRRADGTIETVREAALREANEEMGIVVGDDAVFLEVRPRSIAEKAIRRVAPIAEFMEAYDLKEGDYCSVTTVINCLLVDDIDAYKFKARSDARSLQLVAFNPQTRHLHLDSVDGAIVTHESFAIPDLYNGVMDVCVALASSVPAFAAAAAPATAVTSSGCHPQ